MGAPQVRARSPAPGGSSLITCAPKSASMVEQNGPASAWLRSSTLISSSGSCMGFPRLSGWLRCCHAHRNTCRRSASEARAVERGRKLLERRRDAGRQRHFVREQCHADHDVVADQRAQFDGTARAERLDHAVIRKIRNLAVTEQLGRERVHRELVGLHAIGTAPLPDGVDDALSEAAFLRVRLVCLPFIIAGVMPGRDQNGELGQAWRKAGVIAQVFAEMLNAVGQLRYMYQRQKRSAHAAARAGRYRVVNTALVRGKLVGFEWGKPA